MKTSTLIKALEQVASRFGCHGSIEGEYVSNAFYALAKAIEDIANADDVREERIHKDNVNSLGDY